MQSREDQKMKSFVAVLLVLMVANAALAASFRVVTDAEILSITQALHATDVNSVPIQLDFQAQTTAGNRNDLAPNPLFAADPSSVFNRPTYKAAIDLFDNYNLNPAIQETLTAAQLKEEADFIDAIMETDVMQQAHVFLAGADVGITTDVAQFKSNLTHIWFERHARYVAGVKGTSAWEHVNVGEVAVTNTLTGLHNWQHLYLNEVSGIFNYLGYIQTTPAGRNTIVEMPIEWAGTVYKPKNEFEFGASPELDIAIGTICYLCRPNSDCNVAAANGDKYTFQAYTINELDTGKVFLGSSHPVFP